MTELSWGAQDPKSGGRPSGMFTRRERVRLLLMALGVLLLIGAFFTMRTRDAARDEGESGLLPGAVDEEPALAVPAIHAERLAELAHDATREERVILETAAIEAALADARLLRDAHYAPLGGAGLDAAAAARLLAEPGPARGKLFRARGWVDEIQALPAASGGSAFHRGRLRLERGGFAYFVVAELPEGGLEPEDFARIDGLFLKSFSREAKDGWIEAPLIVGARAVASYPAIPPLTELAPETFTYVRDDSIDNGFSGLPFDEYWELLSYAASVPDGAIDWSQAPELDRERMDAIARDGAAWRGKPVRLPVSQVLGIWLEAQGENPLRLEHLTQGWLGRWDWRGQSKVVHFVAPFAMPNVHERDQIVAHGFFLKDLGYTARDGDPAIAPLLVLQSLEVVPKSEERTLSTAAGVVGALVVLLVVALLWLLRRDGRASLEFQAELVRRRQARRAREQRT